MEMNKKTKKAGVIIGTLSIIAIVVLGAFLAVMNKPIVAEQLPEDHLFIEKTYLLKTGETNKTVNVTCTPYLTNIWKKESGEMKIIAYVVKTSNNIADYKNTVEIGKIPTDSTAELEVPIVLSANTYRVDMLIFEDGKLVLEGSLTIKAQQTFEYDAKGNITAYVWALENSVCSFVPVEHVQ
jgi:hypothetical protein